MIHHSLRRSRLFIATTFASALAMTFSLSAFAQDEAAAADAEAEAEAGGVDLGEEEGEADATGEPGLEKDENELPTTAEETPEEEHRTGDTQLLIGLRYRLMITPKFLINMFGVDGGRTILVNAIGPEIGGRWGKGDHGVTVMFSPFFAGYGMEPTPFKGKNDGPEAWEIINSELNMVYLTLDAMWDYRIVDKLSLTAGFGVGLGIVTGTLYRDEAYINDANPDIPADKDWPNLSYCQVPNGSVQCPNDGNYGEADAWPVYPWLNGQIGLRYQPIDQLVTRLELGLGSSGFWMGLGVDYAHFL
jgi:hypothetical protein